MNLQVKVYKPDYGVILKNYLDPKNWESITVFQYRGFTTTVELERINTRDKKLMFYIRTKCGDVVEANYVTYAIDHPEQTLKVFEKSMKSAMRSTFISAVSKVNYKPRYDARMDMYFREQEAISDAIRGEVEELYADLPDMAQRVIDFDTLLEDIVKDRQAWKKPWYSDATKEYYEQELDVFDGIQTIIEDRNFGEIDLTDSLKMIEALETGDTSELDEDELDEYNDLVNVEDIDLEDFI